MAIATAVFLNEVGGRGVRLVRTVVTAMSGTPSVVAGIFIYSILIIDHVLTYSGFAASLALFVILLPSVTRVVEEVLRVVPSGLREASFALGAPEWRTVWSVVLPTARSGVVTAVLLGIARIVGETAPLLFTAFGSQVINWNAFAHAQGALPLVIWSDVRQAQPVLIDLAFQAAFVLIVHRPHPVRRRPALQPDPEGKKKQARALGRRCDGPRSSCRSRCREKATNDDRHGCDRRSADRAEVHGGSPGTRASRTGPVSSTPKGCAPGSAAGWCSSA